MLWMRKTCLGSRSDLMVWRSVIRSLSTTAGQTNGRTIRNIGVAAHVDAGKTTVVERMLFFSNKTAGMGEVHDGAATMDFLPQERERGITINAASISFDWPPNARVNLIDTPGHYDFTTEVERSMRVLDGAVIVFDAVEGVEAQTETVWRQATRYDVPRIAFANKLDRDGASIEKVLTTMKSRLECETLLIHSPIGEWGSFRGVYDLVHCRKIIWEEKGGDSLGRDFTVETIKELPEQAMTRRQALFEKIADLDDGFAETFLENECSASPSLTELNEAAKKALRRITLAQSVGIGNSPAKKTASPTSRPGVPVLCGAALRNTGVQLVLDAVVDFLPSPSERPPTVYSSSPTAKSLLAFVFKVQNDPNRGQLAFVRIYKGKIRVKDAVQVVPSSTTTSGSSARKERVHGLLQAEAKSYVPFENGEAKEGDVCVIVGCPSLRTGDTLGDASEPLPGLQIPPPVFSIALELESISMEPKLFEAMAIMTRDDPSLVFTNDEETGQFLLSGVGELHLEVTLDRLKREHGVRVETSPPRVAYKETLTEQGEATYTYDKTVNGVKQYCQVALKVSSNPAGSDAEPVVIFKEDIDSGSDQESKPAKASPVKKSQRKQTTKKKGEEGEDGDGPAKLSGGVRDVVTRSILGGLSRGPLKGFPVKGVIVQVDSVQLGNDNPQDQDAALGACRNACISCIFDLYGVTQPKLMEPVFALEATVPEKNLGDVLGDLSGRRRADISTVDAASRDRMLIKARVPAIELLSYSKTLRSLTAGHGAFSATFDRYVITEQ